MTSKGFKFGLVLTCQVLVILSIVVFKMAVLRNGTEVMLKIAPVDPRDMLRGDYVSFQYDISSVNRYFIEGQNIKNGDTVYVVLRKEAKYWVISNVQKEKPADGLLFIRGKVEHGAEDTSMTGGKRGTMFKPTLTPVRIVYGIEQYFIPEGKGRNFNFFNKDIGAKVVIDPQGNAVLKQIYVNGLEWPKNMDDKRVQMESITPARITPESPILEPQENTEQSTSPSQNGLNVQMNVPQDPKAKPLITSITPNFVRVGDTVTITGRNLAGFEGTLGVFIKNEENKQGWIGAEMQVSNPQKIIVTIPERVCEIDTSFSGQTCPAWMNITAGSYEIYAFPWGVSSNIVNLTVR